MSTQIEQFCGQIKWSGWNPDLDGSISPKLLDFVAVPFNFQAKQARLDLASKLSTKQVCGSVFNHGAFCWAWLFWISIYSQVQGLVSSRLA